LVEKQASLLRRTQSPPLSALGPVEEKGRFHALMLNRGWGVWFQTPDSDCYHFSGTTPEAILNTIGPSMGAQGYVMAFSEDVRTVGMMQRPIGHDLPTGVFIFERGLLADHRETSRRGRRIVMGAILGVVVGVAGLFGFVFGSGPVAFAGIYALPIGFGAAVAIAMQGANASYWSDVALIAYFAKGPNGAKGAVPPSVPADYEVYFTVGRAQTQDWFSKTGSGRFIRALLPATADEPTRVLVGDTVLRS
jgi:hypothetical protein